MPVPQTYIQGRAVADARTGYGKDGTPWIIVRVACADKRKDDRGEWYDVRSVFIDVSWWGADDRVRVPEKGDNVTAFGKLYSETEEHEGKTYYKTKLMADFIKSFPKREYSDGQGAQQQTQQQPASNDPWNVPAAQPGGDEEPPF